MSPPSAFDVILKLAAQETVAAGYREMTRAHLLIGLSRFAETAELAQADPAASAALCQEFQGLGIEPKQFRRRLRFLLGNAGTKDWGGMIHRSEPCKTVFALAEAMAAAEHTSMTPVHLLRAALFSLGDHVVDKAGTPPGEPARGTPAGGIPNEL